MIDHLRGRLAGSGKDFVVLECAGIGFRAFVSAATRKDLPPDGESCILRTHLPFPGGGRGPVRFLNGNGARDLSGDDRRERRGTEVRHGDAVGPRRSGRPGGVRAEDAAAFTRVPGIGKKLASGSPSNCRTG